MSLARDEVEGLVGQTIGQKYLLQRLIGAGGMGAVYEAKNLATQRRVALKLMLSSLTHRGDQVERFFREARASSRIEHPNIVQVFDVGQGEDGVFFIVQEFLQGRDLRAVLDERGSLPPHEAFALLAPAISALAAAHAQGVVHRDIKPDNIFIVELPTGERTPKIIDFGIAKLSDPGSENLSVTRTGAAIGTPLYMSPEQARGDRTIDGQTDIWSLGVVLYEALSGSTPFTGESYNAVLAKILTVHPPRLDTVIPGFSREIANVVARALAPSRAERYRTMDEFLAAVTEASSFGSDRAVTHIGPLLAGLEPTARNELAAFARTEQEATGLTGAEGDPRSEVGSEGRAGRVDTIPAVDSPGGDVANARSAGRAGADGSAEGSRSTRRRGPAIAAVTGVLLVGIAGAVAARGGDSGSHAPPRPARTVDRGRPTDSPATPTITAGSLGTQGALGASADASVVGDLMVAITASPATAVIEVDGRRSVGAFAGRVVRDGSPHQVRVYAPGYASRELTFVDQPPEGRIVLERLAGTGPAGRRVGGTTAAPSRDNPRRGAMQREYE